MFKILNSKNEYAYVIKKNSSVLYEIAYEAEGTENSVEITQYFDNHPNEPNGSLTVIHTHKNYSAFSADDYEVFLKHKSIKNMIVYNALGKYYFMQRNNSHLFYLISHREKYNSLIEHVDNLLEWLTYKQYSVLSEVEKDRVKRFKRYKNEFCCRVMDDFFFETCKYLDVKYYPKEVAENGT